MSETASVLAMCAETAARTLVVRVRVRVREQERAGQTEGAWREAG